MVEGEGPAVPFRDALRFWVKLGFVNFGGPTGQIAIMHQELVERRRWIGEERFLHALSYCMLLPGPEATQLAIYVGWLLHRTAGGIVAGVAFVLPAFFLLFGLSWLYAVHGDLPAVRAVFDGLGAAVVGIVAAALLRVARRGLRTPAMGLVAIAAFAALFLLGVPFPVVVLGAGVLGVLAGPRWPRALPLEEDLDAPTTVADRALRAPHARPSPGRTLRVLSAGLVAWWAPLALVIALRGTGDVLAREALFFSQVALVTFGGAYAVLAYIDRAAVSGFGWLAPGEMVTGLGLAETTPGPLIMVTEFVGFLAAYRDPGGLPPAVAGTLGAAVPVWATFAPSFLFIFLGAPSIERLRGHERLSSALSTVTAAVVGVIANLAAAFAVRTLFDEAAVVRPFGAEVRLPVLRSVDPFAVALAAVVFLGTWRLRWNVVAVVLASGVAGWLWSAVR